MKRILLSAAVIALSATAFAQAKIAEVAKFATETIDFGKIKQGVPQKGTFTVTNIGKTPLIIEQANPTCGCTISDYTKEPIAPGKSGVINATYNAAAMGHFEKHLTVKFAGVDEMKSITFTGDVIAAEQFDKDKATGATDIKKEEPKEDAVSAAASKPVSSNTKKVQPATTVDKKIKKKTN